MYPNAQCEKSNAVDARATLRDVNTPKTETLAKVQQETLEALYQAKGLASQIRERLHGPSEEADKSTGYGPGSMSLAFESRSQALSLVKDLSHILEAL